MSLKRSLVDLFSASPRSSEDATALLMAERLRVATLYLAGSGLEIGALHLPQPLPPGARALYVDRLPLKELRAHYPELANAEIREPDLIDDGETLASVAEGSQDFIIANHFLEHCENPIGAICNLLRVLRTGGILFMAVPNKKLTFDRERPETTLEHLLRDDAEGPEWSRRAAYEEFMLYVHGATDPAVRAAEAEKLMAKNYSIHFHVWSGERLMELLAALRLRLGFPFELEYFAVNQHEFLTALRKTGSGA